ncbi:GNAT family N-acetyltransferase [Parageobacillus toebii]|uniref:N-acetyltransferase domain-containing protein n=1 Tax=Parageobacillus toebii TaxID=153151 RepID=A0A150MHC1_9BACL|nr:GNAT family N-acetyltransferase [Parageobacillus toebii]KYD23934.1 hypothetical protein B4110_3839 [Parageobacillus toebii]
MKSNPPILKGTMVTLRPVSPEHDCIPFYNIMLEPEMHVWTGNTVPKNIGEIKQLLQHYAQFEEVIAWAVVRNDTEEMIGTYWIAAPTDVDGKKVISAEAQRIAKECWRKGYTKEARKLVYDFAFNQLGVDEIHAQAWEKNENSCKSMERVGFKLVRQEERLFEKYGRFFQENHYCLTKETWEIIKDSYWIPFRYVMDGMASFFCC